MAPGGHNPFSDALATAAMATIFTTLPRAVAEPGDLDARAAMLVASCRAGVAFSSALVGAVHAVSHALGGIYGVPHGAANACLLPWVLAFNPPAAAARLAAVARTIGAAPPGLDAAAARRGIGALAALACSDGSMYTNPRACAESDLLALIREAY